jgi:hypothetical protein
MALMKKRTRSILEELNSMNRLHGEERVATNGNNIIESAINFLVSIHETYDPDTAIDLEKRFLSAIKNANPKKFRAGVDRIIESRKK